MKKQTFSYYNAVVSLVKTNDIRVFQEHDIVAFVTYNQFGDIEGINFHYGVDVIDQDFKKPCPHVTEIFKRVSGDYSSHKDKSEDKRILKAIKLFTNAFIVGTL